jgi:HAD superfamily hydrolase (TIGR01509 family)
MVMKAVMFDFGATLILDDKFDYLGSLRKAHKILKDAGIAPSFEEFKPGYLKVRERLWGDPEFREYSYNYRLAEVLKLYGCILPDSDKRIQEATDVFSRALIDSLYMEDYLPDLLEQLHKRYKLAVVSNLGIPEVLPIALDKFGIRKHFDAIIASGTVGYRKPGSIIFKEALSMVDVLPEETVFVGDSLYHDVQGAKAVGMKTVWIKRKNQTNGISLSTAPDKTINDLKELSEILETL